VVGGNTLTAKFARTHTDEVTVPFNHGANVVGTLLNANGDAVRGATICVESQTLGVRRAVVPVATETTDVHGHFTYRVHAGPNRRMVVGYRNDSFELDQRLRYHAHAKPTIHLSPPALKAGDVVHITGKVPGPKAAGCVLVLQASSLRSRRWYTFGRATTNKHGVYHATYRFDATTRTVDYRIRVIAPKQAGYAWAAGHSNPAIVRVRAG
jgi:hypothetical protein